VKPRPCLNQRAIAVVCHHRQRTHRWYSADDAGRRVVIHSAVDGHHSANYVADGGQLGQLPWGVGILLHDAVTHPGTWLTPITAGG
jgi:hypothetical protein